MRLIIDFSMLWKPRTKKENLNFNRMKKLTLHLPGPDPDRGLDRQNEDLTIPDIPGSCRFDDRSNQIVSFLVPDHDLDLDLGKHVNDHWLPPVFECDALLLSPPLNFGDSHAGHPYLRKRLFNKFEPFLLDNCLDKLHNDHPSYPFAMLRDVHSHIFLICCRP